MVWEWVRLLAAAAHGVGLLSDQALLRVLDRVPYHDDGRTKPFEEKYALIDLAGKCARACVSQAQGGSNLQAPHSHLMERLGVIGPIAQALRASAPHVKRAATLRA